MPALSAPPPIHSTLLLALFQVTSDVEVCNEPVGVVRNETDEMNRKSRWSNKSLNSTLLTEPYGRTYWPRSSGCDRTGRPAASSGATSATDATKEKYAMLRRSVGGRIKGGGAVDSS